MGDFIHKNLVLYKERPAVGNAYRQIVVRGQCEVRIFEGDVVQTDPHFIANNPDAEVFFHNSLAAAFADADREYTESVKAGWIPYEP